MIPLKAAGVTHGIAETILGRISLLSGAADLLVTDLRTFPGAAPLEISEILLTTRTDDESVVSGAVVAGIEALDHLAAGDIVAVQPSGRIDTVFRSASPNNALFATERCNSKCLMCSQPPRNVDDIDYFYALNTTLLGLIPASLPTLGMTGGEPTLLGARLPALLRTVTERLAQTQFEILSNGRAFARPGFAASVGDACTSKVLFSIPLYSDYAPLHDYVVQAQGAFEQTVLGLHNLAANDVRAELRVVLHRQTFERLPKLASFIQRNLPFVEHVAFMGMEHVGYARMHDDILWIEPPEYSKQLEAAVAYLSAFGYRVSIYNLQPCLVARSLWPFLRPSISDWKREYLTECDACLMRDKCGGVFGTSRRQCASIRAIRTLS